MYDYVNEIEESPNFDGANDWARLSALFRDKRKIAELTALSDMVASGGAPSPSPSHFGGVLSNALNAYDNRTSNFDERAQSSNSPDEDTLFIETPSRANSAHNFAPEEAPARFSALANNYEDAGYEDEAALMRAHAQRLAPTANKKAVVLVNRQPRYLPARSDSTKNTMPGITVLTNNSGESSRVPVLGASSQRVGDQQVNERIATLANSRKPTNDFDWGDVGTGLSNILIGIGDGASLGITKKIREWNDISGDFDPNSMAYRGGDFAAGILGPLGRLAYIKSASKLASKVPASEAAAIALSAERNALKRYFRGRPAHDFFTDYKSAAEAAARFAQNGGVKFAKSAGKTNPYFDALAGTAAFKANANQLSQEYFK
jgi:hypothetical protein